jgi:hypothetical protein
MLINEGIVTVAIYLELSRNFQANENLDGPWFRLMARLTYMYMYMYV